MAGRGRTGPDLTTLDGVKGWLRDAVSDYRWQVRWILLDNGDRLPLPKESSWTAKLLEVTLLDHVRKKAMAVTPRLHVDGDESGRMYPDILLSGPALAHKFAAVDVKAARRVLLTPPDPRRRVARPPVRTTQSQITLGPYNSYFRYPRFRVPGALRAYGDIDWHLDIIAIYDYVEGAIEDLELLVVETWRVASRVKSSGTRDYIGAVRRIDDLRDERGAFATKEEFYEFWRDQKVTRVPRWAATAEAMEAGLIPKTADIIGLVEDDSVEET
jgi:hypothetical protein